MKCKHKEACGRRGIHYCNEEECPEYEVEPMTNSDRIRAMDDEELGEFLNSWADNPWAWKRDGGETIYWLKQPAKEGEENEVS